MAGETSSRSHFDEGNPHCRNGLSRIAKPLFSAEGENRRVID